MNSGGVLDYGALNPENEKDFERAEKHAFQYYDQIRIRKTDVESIAKNTGWKKEAICKIKKHLFITKHDLGADELENFYPNYDIAVSWQNLIEGKSIARKDIIMLKHEYLELVVMKQAGSKYKVAHKIAEEKHNYRKAVEEWRCSQNE